MTMTKAKTPNRKCRKSRQAAQKQTPSPIIVALAVMTICFGVVLSAKPITPAIGAEKQDAQTVTKKSKTNKKNGTLVRTLEDLPDLTRDMYENLKEATVNGDLEELRDIFESNELAPIISNDHTGKPLEVWRSNSVDGTARDIMAILLNILSRPPVKTSDGDYIWPYFARTDLKTLTMQQQIDLFQLLGPEAASAMLKAGSYTFYEIKIGKDGTWHSFHRQQ